MAVVAVPAEPLVHVVAQVALDDHSRRSARRPRGSRRPARPRKRRTAHGDLGRLAVSGQQVRCSSGEGARECRRHRRRAGRTARRCRASTASCRSRTPRSCACSKGEAAEHGAGDVPERRHHVPQRRRDPDRLERRARPRDDRVGDGVGRRGERRGLEALGHLRVHEARAGRPSRSRPCRRGCRPGPGRTRPCLPSTSRTRSSTCAPVRRRPTTAPRWSRVPAREPRRDRGGHGHDTEVVDLRDLGGRARRRARPRPGPRARRTRPARGRSRRSGRTPRRPCARVCRTRRRRTRRSPPSSRRGPRARGRCRRGRRAGGRPAPRSGCGRRRDGGASRARSRSHRRARAPIAPRRARPAPDVRDRVQVERSRASRRARSDWSTFEGSRRVRSSRNRSSSGYMCGTSRGASRESFAKYTRPPASTTRRSSSSSSGASPRALTGMSSASVQPGCGNDSGPGLPAPKRFSTARNDAHCAALRRSSVARTVSVASSGTTYWYWRKPLEP